MIIENVKLSKLDELNHNNFILPTPVITDFIEKNPSFEVYCGIEFRITTPLEEASHLLYNLSIKEGFLYGDVEILDMPQGEILKDLIKKFGEEKLCGAYVAKVDNSNENVKVIEDVSKVMCFYSETGRDY